MDSKERRCGFPRPGAVVKGHISAPLTPTQALLEFKTGGGGDMNSDALIFKGCRFQSWLFLTSSVIFRQTTYSL
jgi:hypothetical protein